MLEGSGLECVRGRRRLFRDLSFTVKAGDCLQLMGPNGSGKTSLLRMLCGLLSPAAGCVLWHGSDIRALGGEYFAAVTYIGHRHAVTDELTAIENLRLSCGLSGVNLSMAEAHDVLGRLGLAGRERQQARFLSEGQHRRLALARLAAVRKPLWLLDEVLESLDEEAQQTVRLLLEEHVARGGIAVVATHQLIEIAGGALIEL